MTVAKSKYRESIAIMSIATIILILAVFSVIISAIGYKGFTEALLEQYTEDAFWTAEMSRLCIDPDMMERYKENGGDNPEHMNVNELLQKICDSTGVEFIYVIEPDTRDYNHITFVFPVKRTGSLFELYKFGYVRETTNDEYRQAYRAMYEDGLGKASVIRDKGYIETEKHVTVMMPPSTCPLPSTKLPI